MLSFPVARTRDRSALFGFPGIVAGDTGFLSIFHRNGTVEGIRSINDEYFRSSQVLCRVNAGGAFSLAVTYFLHSQRLPDVHELRIVGKRRRHRDTRDLIEDLPNASTDSSVVDMT
jgi:hypothetical protein